MQVEVSVNYNFIGGGGNNCIMFPSSGPVTEYNLIGGGCNNVICASYSAIFGGSDNNDNGFQYAGIFGYNIGAVAQKTFHVNCLNACDTPYLSALTSAPPIGTIYACDSGTPFVGSFPLYIQLV